MGSSNERNGMDALEDALGMAERAKVSRTSATSPSTTASNPAEPNKLRGVGQCAACYRPNRDTIKIGADGAWMCVDERDCAAYQQRFYKIPKAVFDRALHAVDGEHGAMLIVADEGGYHGPPCEECGTIDEVRVRHNLTLGGGEQIYCVDRGACELRIALLKPPSPDWEAAKARLALDPTVRPGWPDPSPPPNVEPVDIDALKAEMTRSAFAMMSDAEKDEVVDAYAKHEREGGGQYVFRESQTQTNASCRICGKAEEVGDFIKGTFSYPGDAIVCRDKEACRARYFASMDPLTPAYREAFCPPPPNVPDDAGEVDADTLAEAVGVFEPLDPHQRKRLLDTLACFFGMA